MPVGSCRHDPENGQWPVCDQQYRAKDERQPAGQPPRHDAQKEADDRQRSLHRKSALIGGLPLSEKCAIVQSETRRLLGEANVECRAREERCDDQSQLSCHHD